MHKSLRALLLGLPAPIIAFLAAEIGGGPGALVVISAYFLGCGYVTAHKTPRPLQREWLSLLALMAALMIALPVVALGEGPEGVPPYALLLLAGWEAACAGIYLASRRTSAPASRKATLIDPDRAGLASVGSVRRGVRRLSIRLAGRTGADRRDSVRGRLGREASGWNASIVHAGFRRRRPGTRTASRIQSGSPAIGAAHRFPPGPRSNDRQCPAPRRRHRRSDAGWPDPVCVPAA